MKPQSMSSFFPGCRMSALSLFSFFSAISIDLVEWFVCFHQNGPKSLSPQPQKIQKARWPQEGQCPGPVIQRISSEESAEDWTQKQGCVSIFLERARNCCVLCTWLPLLSWKTHPTDTPRGHRVSERHHLHLLSLSAYLHSTAFVEKRLRLCPSSQGPGEAISATATPVSPVSLSLQSKRPELISR